MLLFAMTLSVFVCRGVGDPQHMPHTTLPPFANPIHWGSLGINAIGTTKEPGPRLNAWFQFHIAGDA